MNGDLNLRMNNTNTQLKLVSKSLTEQVNKIKRGGTSVLDSKNRSPTCRGEDAHKIDWRSILKKNGDEIYKADQNAHEPHKKLDFNPFPTDAM